MSNGMTGPNAATAAAAMPSVSDFLSRVLPWPENGAPGFINIHWTNSKPQYNGMSGRPFTQLKEFLSMTTWCNSHPDYVKDVYFCLSQQQKTGISSTGKVCAARHADDATFLKAIWLDVDGNKPDKPDKGYASIPEAQAAVMKFVADAGLPEPSAVVMSGGGLHVYWISNKPLTPDGGGRMRTGCGRSCRSTASKPIR